jgi:hypothetical protein
MRALFVHMHEFHAYLRKIRQGRSRALLLPGCLFRTYGEGCSIAAAWLF